MHCHLRHFVRSQERCLYPSAGAPAAQCGGEGHHAEGHLVLDCPHSNAQTLSPSPIEFHGSKLSNVLQARSRRSVAGKDIMLDPRAGIRKAGAMQPLMALLREVVEVGTTTCCAAAHSRVDPPCAGIAVHLAPALSLSLDRSGSQERLMLYALHMDLLGFRC